MTTVITRATILALAICLVGLIPRVAAAQAGNLRGGQVQAIAFDPDDSTVIYIGTATGGVFKSTDAGGTWSSVTTTNFSRFVRDLAIDATQSSTIYAATGGLNGGVFKSVDGAVTWTRSNIGVGTNVTAVTIDSLSSAIVYAGTADAGMFKSQDGGVTWAPMNTGLSSVNIRDASVDPIDASVLYVATSTGVFKSTNSGASWISASAGLSDLNVLTIVVDPTDPAVLFAGTTNAGAFRSRNGGESWSSSNQGLTATAVRHFAITPDNPAIVYAATFTGVFKSSDGGDTWTAANSGIGVLQNTVVAGAFHVAVDPANTTTVFVGTLSEAGVFKSTDGGLSWSAANTGLMAVQVSAVVFNPINSTTVYAATTTNAVYKSLDAGATWFEANRGFSTLVTLSLAVDRNNSNVLYAGTANRGGGEGIFKSTNGGATWTRSGFGVSSAVQALALHPGNTSIIYAATLGSGVFRSVDGGASWGSVNSGLSNITVRSFAIDPVDPDTVYAGTASGLFKSTDAGASWFAINVGLTNTNVRSLAIDPVSTLTIYAGTDNGVFKSVNGGDIWQLSNAGLFGPQIVHAIAIDPTDPSIVYLGKASTGLVFKSTNAGVTWTDASEGLPQFPTLVSTLAINRSAPASVIAGTDSSGLFTVRNPNRPPVANAGPDQNIKCACRKGTTVTLDGRASADPDNDPLTYSWMGQFGEAGGPVVSLLFATGRHVVTLTVHDGKGGVAVDSVIITVQHITDGVDLDITSVQFGPLLGSRPCVEPPPDVEITVSVRNNGFVDEPRIATVVGEQSLGFGRSVEVYRSSVAVSSAVEGGSTAWSFPPFRRTAPGAISWTVTVADDNPDQDIRRTRTGGLGSRCP